MAVNKAPGINFVQSNNAYTVSSYATTAAAGTVTTAYANW